jgi:quercetin dioxygenase-like cupin family protein
MFRKKDEGQKRQLLDGVHLKTLVHGEKTLMGEFRLAKGVEIPPHAHPHEQTGIMISGKVRFKVGDEMFQAETGDSWCIPGGIEHAVKVLENSVVVEVFSPIREDYLPE